MVGDLESQQVKPVALHSHRLGAYQMMVGVKGGCSLSCGWAIILPSSTYTSLALL